MMTSLNNIPLYKDAKAPVKRDNAGNSGLWFERFFNQYSQVDGENWQLDTTAKQNFLKQLSGNNNKGLCGNKNQLQRFVKRQQNLVNSQQGMSGVFKNDWHWVSGMGNNHPVENGLLWHTVLGVPYLAGSSVKGLVRAWMEQQEPVDKDKIHQWFGSDDKDLSKQVKTTQAGQVVFYDATPYEKVNLVLDVMTPHTGKWLSDGGLANAPADWHDPIPVFFLSCKKIQLHFSIAKLPHADNNLDINEVWQALIDALDFLGSGAKTATGYGFMNEDEKAKKDIAYQKELVQKALQRASLTAEQQLMQDLTDAFTNDQKFSVSKGKGNSGELAGKCRDLAKIAASNWQTNDKSAMQTLAKDIYSYLGVDIKKKGKVKDLLRSLSA